VVEFGEWLCSQVLKKVSHRHFVLSIPTILRRYFLYDRDLLSDLSRRAWESLKLFIRDQPELNFREPTRGLSFFPVEKRLKYVPPTADVLRIIAIADPDTQDYLWAIKETMGRMGEINRLTWADVNLEERYVALYTRKKGGHLTPRKVPMTQKLFEVLSRLLRSERRINLGSSGSGTGTGRKRIGSRGPTRTGRSS
jgi:integrase